MAAAASDVTVTHPEVSVEDAAIQKLADFKDGKITIGDLMGPLYVNTAEMNPIINIPPGTKSLPFVAPAVDMSPLDEFNTAAVGHVGPRDRPNPTPKERYDLVVIGAGVAGLLSVIQAKRLGKKAALIERHYMGGDCLNVGCFPSKAIIRCARAVHDVKTASQFGVVLPPGEITVDFPAIMQRMRMLRASIAPHDGVERYLRDFCDDIFLGNAQFAGPDSVVVEGMEQPIFFDKAMVATGASAAVVPIPGLRSVPHLTNNDFFNLEELPPRMCLIGAGPIGIELAQTMARFGSQVTIFEIAPQLLPREDPDAAECLRQVLESEIDIQYSVRINGIEYNGPEGSACTKAPWGLYTVNVTLSTGEDKTFECEAVLNATGRVPNVCGLGLETVGVEFDNRTGVHVDECFQTANPNIYACGDCASPFKFTHAADWQARTAIRNMFLGLRERQQNILTPWCTYTEPEIAHVGLYEKEMDDRGIEYTSYKRDMKDVDRCKCEGVTSGFVKISVAKGTDRILGATIVGPNAGDMISEITICMQHNIGCSSLAGTIHPYPTSAEAVRQCAAQYWQRDLSTPVGERVLQMIMAEANPKAAASS